jgi:hypothetical protein
VSNSAEPFNRSGRQSVGLSFVDIPKVNEEEPFANAFAPPFGSVENEPSRRNTHRNDRVETNRGTVHDAIG